MRRVTVLLVALVLATTAACTPANETPPDVQVSGDPGSAPELSFPTPYAVPTQRVEVLVPGDGPALEPGQPVLLDFYAESAEDASVIGDTYSSEPRPFVMSAEALGPDLFAALSGQSVGARILQLAPARQGYPATVAVYDVLPTRATGEPVTPREGLPTVTLAADGEPTITMPDGDPPSENVVQPLIRGSGPQVQAGQAVTVQYVGATWTDGTVFDSTWTDDKLPATFPIGVGSVPDGWDEGIVEQTVGSQVLLVLPPGQGGEAGLNDQTLVYVVDILAASGGPEGS
ncbi:FKBP-type peptidyl-prolyl cis-trans isomerase [Actinotalea sp. M2MS4P-6]|uniref:FKBP-type peptidyl-prolyl cis-trans isomerase n=1 Tax=Actinotalea sp. M2MS4P-6 TaxID=2983762 RepID=UPI0021E44944|nr:FKBP-type peptidyl-prolyl cis-trans isomerase [Actinotalea sp. M2MS4P-6]MCV2394802.1 FKBP-type peptidyl-prolyl cis-trans isomerase [Actinotalea sp. M2MS4P-6]